MTMVTAVAARVTATAVAAAAAGAVAAVAATTTATLTAMTTVMTIASLTTIKLTGAAVVLLLHGLYHRGLVVAQWSSAIRKCDASKQATLNSTDAPMYAPSSLVEDVMTERDI